MNRISSSDSIYTPPVRKPQIAPAAPVTAPAEVHNRNPTDSERQIAAHQARFEAEMRNAAVRASILPSDDEMPAD